MPSDDTSPRCVAVTISGDQITMVGDDDGGGTTTLIGTIAPL